MVSFGWVVMLIVLYIVLVGPLEYYLLKRILGRLELTWLTFPIIAPSCRCVRRTFSAESVKGREQRVNKIDVVDVDLTSNRVYGTTWFTIFSPKIDNYTIGVEPGSGWGTSEGANLSWMGPPRGGRPGLIRRKYGIHEGANIADGLEKRADSGLVNESVWGELVERTGKRSDQQPGRVESNITHPPGDRTKVVGTFRHNLPVEVLTDCVVFYGGQAYPLPGDVIVRGETFRLVLDQGTIAAMASGERQSRYAAGPRAVLRRAGRVKASRKQQQQVFTGPLPLWGVLFHEAREKRRGRVRTKLDHFGGSISRGGSHRII